MQEIQLTSDNNTIHVDDVDVSKGMWAVNENGISYVFSEGDSAFYIKSSVSDRNYIPNKIFGSLKDLINYYGDTFYTIPDNKRITTTKALTVDDLNGTDHVGVINGFGQKCYIATYNRKFMIISTKPFTENWCNYTQGNGDHDTIQSVIKDNTAGNIKSVYRFHTRKELYKWLAED